MADAPDHISDIKASIARLEKQAMDDRTPEADRLVFERMKATYLGIEQWGRFSRIIIVTLGLIAAGITAWDVILDRIRGG